MSSLCCSLNGSIYTCKFVCLPPFPGVILCPGVCPDTAPGQSSSMCLVLCEPWPRWEISAGRTLPSAEAAQLSSCYILFIAGYKWLDEGQVRKLWQSWEEKQHLFRGQGEGGQLCWLRHLNSLPTAAAVGVGSPSCRLVLSSGVVVCCCSCDTFQGGSTPGSLPAVLLSSGAVLGTEQHPSS